MFTQRGVSLSEGAFEEMEMNGIVANALMNGLAVAFGLYLLWSAMRVMVPRNRAIYASIAGAFSMIVTLIVAAMISA